jgi:hypothetical protein
MGMESTSIIVGECTEVHRQKEVRGGVGEWRSKGGGEYDAAAA